MSGLRLLSVGGPILLFVLQFRSRTQFPRGELIKILGFSDRETLMDKREFFAAACGGCYITQNFSDHGRAGIWGGVNCRAQFPA